MRKVVLLLLGASLPREVQSIFKLQQPNWPGLDKVIDDLSKATDSATEKSRKKAEDNSQNAKAHAEETFDKMKKGEVHKPSMDDIEVMRAYMCWNRPNLLHHEDCMNWMVDHCKKETTREGYCRKLALYLENHCARNEELACDYAKELDIQVHSQKEFEEEHAGEEKEIEEVEEERKEIDARPEPQPAPAPALAHSPMAAPGPAPMPTGLSMKVVDPGLPEQGYNEHSDEYVMHEDRVTMTKDWRLEWPMMAKSENGAVHDICADYPDHAWCKLKLSKAARREYARSHP